MDKQETIEEAKLRAANYMSLKGALEPKQKTLEEAAANLADPNLCKTDNWIAGAKWQQERMYSEEEMINFAEFVATYTDKNRNVYGEMLHAKSKYDGAERTIDLLEKWFEQFKNK